MAVPAGGVGAGFKPAPTEGLLDGDAIRDPPGVGRPDVTRV